MSPLWFFVGTTWLFSLAAVALGVYALSERGRRSWLEKVKGMAWQDGEVIQPEPEPEEQVNELIERLIPTSEVEAVADHLLQQAVRSGVDLTPEEAKKEAESIMFSSMEMEV